MPSFGVVLLSLQLSLLAVGSGRCSWDSCLHTEKSQVCACLKTRLLECSEASCQTALTPTPQQVRKLVVRLECGETNFAAIAFLVLPLLSGGDLEDTMRGLASLSSASPSPLLRAAHDQQVTARQLATIVCMLPLDTVDDEERKLRIVVERIRAMNQVDEPPLIELRNAALEALMQLEKELRKVLGVTATPNDLEDPRGP